MGGAGVGGRKGSWGAGAGGQGWGQGLGGRGGGQEGELGAGAGQEPARFLSSPGNPGQDHPTRRGAPSHTSREGRGLSSAALFRGSGDARGSGNAREGP